MPARGTSAWKAAVLGGVPRRLGIASNRNGISPILLAGLNWSTRVRKRTGVSSVGNIVLRCPWWYVSNVSAETNVGNTATIYASIEYPAGSGTFYQAKKSGSASITTVDGGYVDFDPIPLHIPGNTNFDVHCFVVNSVSTNKMPANCALMLKCDDGYEVSNSALVNKTMTGGETTVPSSGYLAAGYSPIVIGMVETTARDCIIAGDSIAYGANENATLATAGDAYGNLGAFERILGLNNFAFINLSRAGTKASQWQAAGAMDKRLALLTGIKARRAINELGVNDYTATATAWAGYMGTVNGRLAPFCKKVVGATITPYSTSTDLWATTANQTVVTGNTDQFSTRVRAGTIAGQSGYLNYNEALADITNERIWRNPASAVNPTAGALTGDGLHTLLLGAQTAAEVMSADPLLN